MTMIARLKRTIQQTFFASHVCKTYLLQHTGSLIKTMGHSFSLILPQSHGPRPPLREILDPPLQADRKTLKQGVG